MTLLSKSYYKKVYFQKKLFMVAKKSFQRFSNVIENSRITMRCEQTPFHENHNLFLSWFREDNQSLPDKSFTINGTLYIDNIKVKDTGHYLCFGRNGNGELIHSDKTYLNVIGK